jgi:hypothetical protein
VRAQSGERALILSSFQRGIHRGSSGGRTPRSKRPTWDSLTEALKWAITKRSLWSQPVLLDEPTSVSGIPSVSFTTLLFIGVGDLLCTSDFQQRIAGSIKAFQS